MGDLHYLSERLARDLIDEVEAKRARQLQEPRTEGFEPVVVEDIGELIGDNPHSLADHAEQAALASGEVGDLAQPSRYVLLRNLRTRLWVFKAKGERAPLTAFVTVRRDPHLAVLLGSPGNVIGWKSVMEIDGWVPSSTVGLRQVIGKLKAESGEADLGALDWHQTIDTGTDFAVNLNRTPDLDQRADVLARIYEVEEGVTAHWRTTGHPTRYEFKKVLMGAPVFIRDPRAG